MWNENVWLHLRRWMTADHQCCLAFLVYKRFSMNWKLFILFWPDLDVEVLVLCQTPNWLEEKVTQGRKTKLISLFNHPNKIVTVSFIPLVYVLLQVITTMDNNNKKGWETPSFLLRFLPITQLISGNHRSTFQNQCELWESAWKVPSLLPPLCSSSK